jgi:hypothetical protein
MDVKPDRQALRDVEEEEMRLLKGIALVQSRVFEGKVVQKGSGNKDIARAWEDVQKRAKVDRLVMVDGMQVVAEHIAPLVVTVSLFTFRKTKADWTLADTRCEAPEEREGETQV